MEKVAMGHTLDSKKEGQPNQKEQENSDNNNPGQTERREVSRYNNIQVKETK